MLSSAKLHGQRRATKTANQQVRRHYPSQVASASAFGPKLNGGKILDVEPTSDSFVPRGHPRGTRSVATWLRRLTASFALTAGIRTRRAAGGLGSSCFDTLKSYWEMRGQSGLERQVPSQNCGAVGKLGGSWGQNSVLSKGPPQIVFREKKQRPRGGQRGPMYLSVSFEVQCTLNFCRSAPGSQRRSARNGREFPNVLNWLSKALDELDGPAGWGREDGRAGGGAAAARRLSPRCRRWRCRQ